MRRLRGDVLGNVHDQGWDNKGKGKGNDRSWSEDEEPAIDRMIAHAQDEFA